MTEFIIGSVVTIAAAVGLYYIVGAFVLAVCYVYDTIEALRR